MAARPVTHILLVTVRDGTTSEQFQEHYDALISLKDRCLHPKTRSPYILSAKGGKNDLHSATSSIYTHVFVMEFANRADRDFYLVADPVHLAMKQKLLDSGLIDRVNAVDFIDGGGLPSSS